MQIFLLNDHTTETTNLGSHYKLKIKIRYLILKKSFITYILTGP